MKNKPTIGLVLSGGGVRGAAHVGLLKAFEEHDIEADILSGSSAGAMVGALYAAGYKAAEIFEFFKENANVFKWKNFALNKPGFLDADKYIDLFHPWLDGQTFETLKKELYICVTDILNGKNRFFSKGELVRPIMASAAVPGVFTPIEIDDNWYVDGGTMNNFPVEPLIGKCDVLVGSFVSPKKPIKKRNLSTSLQVISRANDLSFLAASQAKFGLCDYVFNPIELAKYATFDNKKVNEIYMVGYEYASKNMTHLKSILEQYEQPSEKQSVT